MGAPPAYQETLLDAYLGEQPKPGFNFTLGSFVTAYLPGVLRVGGTPTVVEYYVSTNDAWRPESISVRLPSTMVLAGSGAWYATGGNLCWVDADGQAYSQTSLGCPYVGQSATATLRTSVGLDSNSTDAERDMTSVVGVGLFRAAGTPDAADALRHEDVI
jgi:hypothetical protein